MFSNIGVQCNLSARDALVRDVVCTVHTWDVPVRRNALKGAAKARRANCYNHLNDATARP